MLGAVLSSSRLLRAGSSICLALAIAFGACIGLSPTSAALAQSSQPKTVRFLSADAKTRLTGYLFAPAGKPKMAPAVVLLHDADGVYSKHTKGNYSAVNISKHIRAWAQLWAAQGYWALAVDSFGPRGFPSGLAHGPGAGPVSAGPTLHMRALDAYGALAYLASRPRIEAHRIAIEGWSNGASAVLAIMARPRAGGAAPSELAFRAAIALSPGCALERMANPAYMPYAPLRIFLGASDQHATAASCEALAANSRSKGANIGLTMFAQATHDFDNPPSNRPESPADVAAARQTRQKALAFFAARLKS